MARVRFDRREDTRELPRLHDPRNRCVDGGADVRVRAVADVTHVGGEVARADEQAVDAIDGRNRFEIPQRDTRFDLHDDAQFAVDALDVVLDAAVAIGPHGRGDASDPFRRIARRRDRLPCFLGILYPRHEKALHADIEEPFEQNRIVPRRPHDRRRGAAGHRLQLAEHHGQLVRRVLGVEQEPVEA